MAIGLGIGLGGALTGLGQGIYQGEEIARRRQREDEQAAMAKAEFENRQSIFGRQKKQWTQEDETNAATAEYLASDKSPEAQQRMYDRINAAGAGQMALQSRGILTQQALAEQQLSQGREMFDINKEGALLNIEQARAAKLDRDMVRSWATGDYTAIQKALQAKADSDPEHYGSKVESVAPITDSRGRIMHGPNGLTQVKIDYVDGDGNKQTKVMDVGQFGAFLNAPGLQTLAAQEAQNHNMQVQMAWRNEDKRDMKAKEYWGHNLAERQAQAKPWQDEYDQHMKAKDIMLKTYAETLGMSPLGAADPKAKAIKEEMDAVEAKANLAKVKRDASLHGFDWYEGKDMNGVPVIDLKRSITPAGSRDATNKMDWRPKDQALYSDSANLPRLLSMTTPRAEGESDDAYKNRLNDVAKAGNLKGGWYTLMAPADGSHAPVIVPAGSLSTDKTDAQRQLEAKGWQVIPPRGFNFGNGLTAPDVQEALNVQDQFMVSSRGVAGRVGSGSGGRIPAGGHGSNSVYMVPGMRSR